MVRNVVTGAVTPSQLAQILAAHGFAGQDRAALIVVSRRTARVLWASDQALTRLQASDAAELHRILFDTATGRAYAARLGRLTAQGSYRLERLTLADRVTPTIVATYAVEAEEPLALLHVRELGVASTSVPAKAAPEPVATPVQQEPVHEMAAVPQGVAPTRILWETDAAAILTRIGPNAQVLGPRAPKAGDDLPSLIRAFAPEAAERILLAARQRGSVAPARIDWPQGSTAALAVDLGAAPRRGSAPGLRGFFALYDAPRAASLDGDAKPEAALAAPIEEPLPSLDEPEHAATAQLPEEAEVADTAAPPVVTPVAPPPAAPEPPVRGNVVHFPAMRLGAVPANFGTALGPLPDFEAMSLTGADFTMPQWSEAPAPPARPEPDMETLSPDERDAFEHIRKVLGTRPFTTPGSLRSETPAPPTSLLADLPALLDRVPVALRLEARGITYANTAWRERLGPEARQGDGSPNAETARFDFAGAPASLSILPAMTPDPRMVLDATTEALDLATDGHLRLDESGAVMLLSPKAARLLGLDARATLGRPFTSLLGEGQSPGWQALAAVATGSVAVPQGPSPLRLRNAAGQALPMQIRLGRIDGTILCCLTLDRQAPANDSAEAARREAERTSALKSEFLAKVSHEIRTPLNAILGFAEVIRDERLGPVGNARYLEYLRDIHASGTHVMSLVNDLLDLSRIEAGRMDLNLAAVDANAIVQSCVNTLQTQAHGARVIVRLSLTPRLPATLADERSLRQIVLNLLSNAIKFNEPGGQVIVSTALAGPHAVAIRIRDTGVGMTEDEIATAMEPFRQLSTVNRTGSGLGLPLTKALVEANCASMAIKSARGEGTLVEVTFPLVESDSMSLPAE